MSGEEKTAKHERAAVAYAHRLVTNAGLMWRTVDVTTHVTGADTTGCDLTPLHPPGQTSGYYVTNNNNAY